MENIFSKRLKELRNNAGLTQKDLADILGLDQRTISSYEHNRYEPTLQVLTDIANLFKISTDYLLGLTNNKN